MEIKTGITARNFLKRTAENSDKKRYNKDDNLFILTGDNCRAVDGQTAAVGCGACKSQADQRDDGTHGSRGKDDINPLGTEELNNQRDKANRGADNDKAAKREGIFGRVKRIAAADNERHGGKQRKSSNRDKPGLCPW